MKPIRRLFIMKTSLKHTKERGPIGTIATGLIISTALYLVLAAVCAAVLGKLSNPLGGLGAASLISFFPTALISGFIISKLKGDGGVIIAGASAFIFVLLLFICCAVINHGKIPFTPIISYAAYVVLSIFGAAFGKRRSRRRH